MQRPNVFVIGAPKCGTTALYSYLRSHPRVFFAQRKEPHHFSTDLKCNRYVYSERAYATLFRDATDFHDVVGEASTHYLYSQVAVPRILEVAPRAKLIAMLRNPVALVHSYHSQALFDFRETEASFEKAWHLQDLRAKGRSVPKQCWAPFSLQYAAIGRLGEQVERLLNTVPREQVKFILFDDFAASPNSVYEDVLRFLGLSSDGRLEFPAINSNKKSHPLDQLVRREPFPLNILKRTMKKALPKVSRRLGQSLRRTSMVQRPPLRPEFHNELIDYFADDVRKLERLLGLQLTHWRSINSTSIADSEGRLAAERERRVVA